MSNGWIKTSHISCRLSQRRKCKTDDTTPGYKQVPSTSIPPTKSPPPPPPRKAKKNDVVTIDFKLSTSGRFVAEPLFDTSGTLSFILGGGNHLPGIHSLIENMSVGDTVRNVPIDAGWGERDPSLVAKVPKEQHGELDYDKIAVGTELVMQTGYPCVVTEVTEEYFVIDANPPLAGATYDVTLTLKGVESAPGPAEMIYQAETTGKSRYEVATFALGCFWGGELAFMRETGVVGTKVGYTQGQGPNPTYEEVCSGSTGHAEAIQVVFDPEIVTFERLVNLAIERLGDSIFLLNQVGNDVGTQYRHGVYYHNDEQKDIAHRMLDNLGGSKTEILPAVAFYDAEEYHQQYLLKGGQSAKKGTSEYIRCYG